MIKIQWNIAGYPNPEEEVFLDEDYDRALTRYKELVNHQRCFNVRMILGNEDETDEVIVETDNDLRLWLAL